MSIVWGDISFDGPSPITDWNPPYCAVIYVIMHKPDYVNEPKKFRLLYIEGLFNLSDRRFYREQDKYNCWIKEADSEDNLYIGIHKMPNSTADERIKIESNLINQYNPVCNQ